MLSFTKIDKLAHLGFSNTADFYHSIVDKYPLLSDALAAGGGGQLTPYASSVLIEAKDYWDISFVYEQAYISEEAANKIKKNIETNFS